MHEIKLCLGVTVKILEVLLDKSDAFRLNAK